MNVSEPEQLLIRIAQRRLSDVHAQIYSLVIFIVFTMWKLTLWRREALLCYIACSQFVGNSEDCVCKYFFNRYIPPSFDMLAKQLNIF